MADKQVSALPEALQIDQDDLLVLEKAGEAKKLSGETLLEFCRQNFSAQEIDAWLAAHPEATTTVQDGSITRQKLSAQLEQLISRHSEDIDVLDSRVDEILGLTPGSTTGDAQLNDIKIGWDGKTYDTPGNAVREQVNALNAEIAEISDAISRSTVTEGLNLSSDGSVFMTKLDEHTVKITGTGVGNRRMLCLNGQSSVAYSTTAFSETLPAGTYRFRIVQTGTSTDTLPIVKATYTTYADEFSITDGELITFPAAVMIGIMIRTNVYYGTTANPTYVEIHIDECSAFDKAARNSLFDAIHENADYRANAKRTFEKTALDGYYQRFAAASNHHLRLLPYVPGEPMGFWREDGAGNKTQSASVYAFTDFLDVSNQKLIISAPNQYVDGEEIGSNIFVYFYTKTGDQYEITWDVLYHRRTSNTLNLFTRTTDAQYFITDCPENCYVRYYAYAGNDMSQYAAVAALVAWDGEKCGIDLSGGIDNLIQRESPTVTVSSGSNNSTAVFPGSTLFAFTDGTVFLYMIAGIKADGTKEWVSVSYGKRSFLFPRDSGYVAYLVSYTRPLYDSDGNPGRPSPDGEPNFLNDLTNHVFVITEKLSIENIIGDSAKVAANAKKANALEWKAQKDFYIRYRSETNPGPMYRTGVTYHGIPYGGVWDEPDFIGWHISPHTFVNAANDENSALYTDVRTVEAEVHTPYYGIVCSAYQSLINGFPIPNTNAGFLYDPDILNGLASNLPLGEIWSDGSHCVFPIQRLCSDGLNIVRIAESRLPLSMISTRFDNLSLEQQITGYSEYDGMGYFEGDFYTSRHKRQTFNMADIPYADFDDVTITGGTARPHRGDKCVYTSRDSAVRINLVGTGIEMLRLYRPDGDTVEIETSGATHIDVKPWLSESGIYRVCTNIDEIEESFEYVDISGINITPIITDGIISFSSNDFWYAVVHPSGHWKLSRPGEQACIAARENGDYSDWRRDGMMIESCNAIFCKGGYGAYVAWKEGWA